MRVTVLAPPPRNGRDEAAPLLETLSEHGVEAHRAGGPAEVAGEGGDVVVVVGDATFTLRTVRDLPPKPPVLTVSPRGPGVLAEITGTQFEGAVRALASGRFDVETVDRMRVVPSEHEEVLALNEAAFLPATGGQFVRHALHVNDELLWRDRGDGLIVATPTGSTAYALAAGGPVVVAGAPVLSVVPVNSSEGQRPVVVPQTAELVVTDCQSAGGVDLVVDGTVRERLGRDEEVHLTRADRPASFVRLSGPRFGRLLDKLKVERELGPELKDAPPSAKFTYKLLEYAGPLTQQEIIKESQLAARTVRNALTYLVDHGIVAKQPSLRDARQDVYDLAERVGGGR